MEDGGRWKIVDKLFFLDTLGIRFTIKHNKNRYESLKKRPLIIQYSQPYLSNQPIYPSNMLRERAGGKERKGKVRKDLMETCEINKSQKRPTKFKFIPFPHS